MLKTKVIYDNGSSNCTVEFDGEIVTIKQTLDGDEIGNIYLYTKELEEISEFIKENK